jgi:hypothetical protein
MKIRTLFAAAAAAGLVIAPLSAQAEVRKPARIEKDEAIAANPWIPWLVGLAALVAIIIVISDDDGPSSP